MMALVVAGDAGTVAALRRAPLTAGVVLDEEEQAVRCQARPQPVPRGAGEEFDPLVGDQLHGEVGGGAAGPVGDRRLLVAGPDEFGPRRRERVERGDRLRPGQFRGGGRRARVTGRLRGQPAQRVA
jgi:hypothetical protein